MSDESRPLWRRAAPIVLRVVVVGALGWWITRSAGLDELWSSLRRLPIPAALTALGLSAINMGIAGVRWRVLMRAFGASPLPAVGDLVRVFFVGLFYNTFVPGSVGGDVVRGAVSRRHFESAAASYVVVALERVIGLSALGVVFGGGLVVVLLRGRGPAAELELVTLWPWIAALVGLGVAVLIAARLSGWLARMWAQIPRVERRRDLVAAFGISVLGHGLTVLAFWTLARGLGLPIGLEALVVVVPLGLVAAVLPIAIAGIGPREAALVGLLGLWGVPKAEAAAASLSYAAVLIGLAAIGGLVQLGRRGVQISEG